MDISCGNCFQIRSMFLPNNMVIIILYAIIKIESYKFLTNEFDLHILLRFSYIVSSMWLFLKNNALCDLL